MPTTPAKSLAIGDRLPAVTLERVGNPPVDLRRVRHDSSVLLFPHPDCDGCTSYLHALEGDLSELTAWGGRSIVVAPDQARAQALTSQLASWVVIDPRGRARSHAGIGDDSAAVLVTDRFGIVYLAQVDASGHDFAAPPQLLEEVRHIVTQCPECGVPDDPLRGEEAWRR